MGAIRLIQKPLNGQITFTVPDDMRDEAIMIEFRPAREESQGQTLAEASQELFNKLPKADPNFDWDSVNVYEQ
jgi:hypothetical protein